jgi:hypothetical protein
MARVGAAEALATGAVGAMDSVALAAGMAVRRAAVPWAVVLDAVMA